MKIKVNNALFILFIAFLFSVLYMARQAVSLDNVDYIWNYGFAAKISLGLIPYRDFNLLQTPFSFYLSAIFLKIFGNYIIVHIIVGALMTALTYYLFYRVLLRVNGNKLFSLSILLITLIYTLANFTFYSYNTPAMAIILAIILCEFGDRLNRKNNILIGLLLGLLFMTKQNIGAVTAVMMTLNVVFSRQSFRNKLNVIVIRAGVSFAVLLSYLIYLYFNGALYSFIDYAFLGILDFSEENKHVDSYFVFMFLLLPAAILLKAIWMLIRQKRYALNDKLFIVITYAIAALLLLYPMVDFLHISISVIITFVLLSFIYQPEQITSARLMGLCVIILCGCFIGQAYPFISGQSKPFIGAEKYYRYMAVNPELIEHFADINGKIEEYRRQGHQAVIVDSTAMAYWLDAGIYNDRFDFLVQGNVGYHGTEKYLNKFKQLGDGTLFLVGKSKKVFGMTALNLFIICHYQFVEDIPNFWVYRKVAVEHYQNQCHSDKAREFIESK
jgi:hypothetical protein